MVFDPLVGWGESDTKLTIIHTSIPDGQGEGYRQGWLDYYFKPMKEYFGKKKGS